MRRYELMLLLRPDLEDDKLQAAVEKVTRAIVNAGGSLSKVSPWGKRRLAYDIQRHREASYFLIHFDIEPSQVREIERGMLISEEILRHLVTVLEDRGPADEELAPAAAARGTDDAFGTDADDPAIVSQQAAAPTAIAETVAPDQGDEALDVVDAEVAATGVADQQAAVEATTIDTSDDEADAVPADEEEPA
ncbi:MAG TPA: 30S ribosomal protein S6 [Candidatus Limnocylindrales bacterium]|nr:30S ribosomal protein S6 [Candidatus Limnocylindrales bacterium]